MQRAVAAFLVTVLAGLFATGPASVFAEDLDEVTSEDSAAETLLDLAVLEESEPLSDEELNTHRARENIEVDQITINDQDQGGNVSDNTAVGNTNGDNLINGDAFSNSSGFLNTVQNTGNNVLIQHSTIINVTMDTAGE